MQSTNDTLDGTMILTLARCWSAKEGEDEAEGGGGGMLRDGEPGNKLKKLISKKK